MSNQEMLDAITALSKEILDAYRPEIEDSFVFVDLWGDTMAVCPGCYVGDQGLDRVSQAELGFAKEVNAAIEEMLRTKDAEEVPVVVRKESGGIQCLTLRLRDDNKEAQCQDPS